MTLKNFVRANAPFYPNFSAEDLTAHLNLFDMDYNVRLDKLSMGQKKKVFLAFAMACNTKVLIMDEPTNGLDIPGKSAFRKFVASSMSDDKIFIISTHQIRDVGQILDHVIIINNHKVLLDKSVSEIQSRLQFVSSSDPALATEALFCIPSLGNNTLILPNLTDEDSEVNYEALFEFAVSNPDGLSNAFN